jgi:hypothetical protein
MTEELEKCPFCGGDAKIINQEFHKGVSVVACQECFCSTEMWSDPVPAWNTRAQPKYKRVDLDNHGCISPSKDYRRGFYEAIDDIKAKYGDLYVEVK